MPVRRAVPDMTLREPGILPHGDGTAHVDFSPLGPPSGEHTARAEHLVRSRLADHARGCVNTIVLRRHSAHHISTAFFNHRDRRQLQSGHDCY
ncbi:hypothetical protein [Streptomyces sp. A30]|uniref:hypothetical protein n=1 Tax=Streptomyces sp. A30 TaxID=2789273 RepID=UPI0039801147